MLLILMGVVDRVILGVPAIGGVFRDWVNKTNLRTCVKNQEQ